MEGKKIHYRKIAELGCCICGQPAEIHHITGIVHRGLGSKSHWTQVIPLCVNHHRAGKYAVHGGVKTFEERYGTQEELLAKVLLDLKLKFLTERGRIPKYLIKLIQDENKKRNALG